MLLLLALKCNLQEKAFPSAKTKTNPNSARKLAKSSSQSFLLSIYLFISNLFIVDNFR